MREKNNSRIKTRPPMNRTGRILGLMPHPERNIFKHSPPNWQDGKTGGEGLQVFKNAVEYFK